MTELPVRSGHQGYRYQSRTYTSSEADPGRMMVGRMSLQWQLEFSPASIAGGAFPTMTDYIQNVVIVGSE